MTKLSSFAFALCCVLGCSSHNGNDNGNPDGNKGNGDGSQAQQDAPTTPPGTDVIPLGTPTGDDQGSFYTIQFMASGGSFAMDLDTGSTSTGVATSACTTCTGLSPLYMPGAMAMDTHMTASTQYADGSGWSGEIYSDKAGLGHGSPDLTLAFVGITDQTNFFAANEYQGIFGLGPTELLETGTTSYLDLATKAGTTPIMAFELCPTAGTMWLGGFDQSKMMGAPQYTPLIPISDQSPFYAVNLTDMGIGGTSLGFNSSTFQNPIVDTGTSLFYVPTAVQTALISKVNASSGWTALFGTTKLSAKGSGCVTKAGVTAQMVDAMLPPMSMSFAGMNGGPDITVSVAPTQSYLEDAGGGQFCLVVEGGGDNGNGTMGDTILRAFVTVVDLQHNQVGWGLDAGCAPAAPIVRGPITEHGHGPHHGHALR
ncbi:MAG TPA: pepsin-like aspartyl protease [Kofleriaceae bacterium]|nr:pepsin-like aspartyl protease [Kofleriaceae bacterium]